MNLDEYEIMYRVEDAHWWYVSLRGMIDLHWRRFAAKGPVRLLDVGCGTGAVLNWFSLQEGVSAAGVDYSGEAIRFCRKRGQIRSASASANELPFGDDSFDAVVSFDVLCHRSIQDPQVPLREMRRVLCPGGMLLLNLPAYQWLYSSHDVAVHTVRRFTRSGIFGMLRETGFETVDATYWNTVLFPAIVAVRLWRRLFPPSQSDLADGAEGAMNHLFEVVLEVERAVARRFHLPFGLSVFVVARKPQ